MGKGFSYDYNSAQKDALTSNAQEIFFIGGVGSGKSFAGGVFIRQALEIPNCVAGIYAPTHKLLNNATLRQVTEAWAVMGLLRGRDYVINIMPPKSWNIKSIGTLDHKNIITFRNGTYVFVGGLDDPNSARGVEFDRIFVDEFRDIKDEARDVLLGRLRGAASWQAGIKPQILYCTTPPDNTKFLRDLEIKSNREDIGVQFIFSSTYINKKNLRPDYIEDLKAKYDPLTFQREVLGQLVMKTDNAFAYCFNLTKHVSEEAVYNPKLDIYLSFDFNYNPMTCAVFQHGRNWIRQIAEFRIPNSNVEEMCKRILIQYPNKQYFVTGDASGRQHSVLNAGNYYAYQIIENMLKIHPSRLDKKKSNPHIKDTYVLMNSMFTHYDIKIHPSCHYTIEDLINVQYHPVDGIDKKNQERTHLLDCFRYYLSCYFKDFLQMVGKV